jgi:hypothetical protein
MTSSLKPGGTNRKKPLAVRRSSCLTGDHGIVGKHQASVMAK